MSSPSAGKRRMDTDVLKLYPWNSLLFLLLAICISAFFFLFFIPTSFLLCPSPLSPTSLVLVLSFSFALSHVLAIECKRGLHMVANARLRSMHGMLRLDRLFIRYDQFIGRRETTRCNVMMFHDYEGYLIPRFVDDGTQLFLTSWLRPCSRVCAALSRSFNARWVWYTVVGSRG